MFVLARTLIVVLAAASAPPPSAVLIPVEGPAAQYWSRWRGPSGQGIVALTNYVDTWSPTTNVKWRAAVPGRGHSSPVVWKDHLFLTTSRDDSGKVSMLAYNRTDGRLLWETALPTSGIERTYWKNSKA